MKVNVSSILQNSEKLLKSAKTDKIDPKPEEIVANGKDIKDEVTENEKNKKEAENQQDELTPEEKEALESGEYDYDPNYKPEEDTDSEEEDDKEEVEEAPEDTKESEEKDSDTEENEEKDEDTEDKDDRIEKALGNLIEISSNILARLEKLEGKTLAKSSTPQPIPSGKSVVSKDQVLHKNFNTSAGIETTGNGYERLSKSARASILSDAFIKGNTSITPMDVLRAEQTGYIKEEHKSLFIKEEK